MNGLKMKKYLHTTRKHFDPFSLAFGLVGLGMVVWAAGASNAKVYLTDTHSITIIFGGTLASLLFQYDILSIINSFWLIGKSFLGTPDRQILNAVRELDRCIVTDGSLMEMREGRELNGELLNDIVYMHRQGLLFEEIDAFVTSRISDEFLGRQIAVTMLKRAGAIAPSLGLFGTVVGLVGVLKNLQSPGQIGNSMSLALLTTVYGAGLNSLVFSPLAGRLEHHNTIHLEVHKQLLNKCGILLNREERRMENIEPLREVRAA